MNTLISIPITFLLLMNYAIADDELNYQEAKETLQQNCGDCYGETKAGLERGIMGMEALLKNNIDIPLEGYFLLADSYNFLAIKYYEYGSNQSRDLLNKKIKIHSDIGELLLDKIESGMVINKDKIALYTEILNEYANTLDDKSKPSVRENILSFNPDDVETIFSYGQDLLILGREEDGLYQLEKSFALSKNLMAFHQAIYLMNLYNNTHRASDTRRIYQLLQAKNIDQDIEKLKDEYITKHMQSIDVAPIAKPVEKTIKPEQKKQPVETIGLPSEQVIKTKQIQLWLIISSLIILIVLVFVSIKKINKKNQ